MDNKLIKVDMGILNNSKLKSNGIRTIKNQVLLAPGVWNGREYTKEEIKKAFHNTDWDDKDVISLIADHNDDDDKGRPLTISDWLGYISNPLVDDEGFLRADLNICDSELATKLIDGKAPFGISPFLFGSYDGKAQRDFVIKNNAIVVEPACKKSFINKMSDDGTNEKLSEISAEDRIKKKLDETTTKDVEGSSVESKGLQPIDYKKKKGKKKSNLIDVKGGKNKMEEVQKEEVKIEEESKEEEKVVEDSESKEEEVKEEPKEEASEESVEEESEEKLMEQIAKLTEKFLKKRKTTPEQAKMQKLESEVASLKKMIAKLGEEKAEATEEVKDEAEKSEESSEKLSAKPMLRESTIQSEEGFSMFGNGASKGSKELANMLGF